MEESRLKFAEDEQPPAGQEAPARRMEAAAPKPGAGPVSYTPLLAKQMCDEKLIVSVGRGVNKKYLPQK